MHNNDELQNTPVHVAIVMDGNGRWATRRGMPRAYGHREGVQSVRRIVRHAADRGVQHLTLYSFSTENWSRPKEEVNALFALLKAFVSRDLTELHDEGVRIRILGRRDNLPADIAEIIANVEEHTANNDRFFLHIAFNYGGRDEILRAARAIVRAQMAGETDVEKLDEAGFATFLDTSGAPDPELIIRTGGERRISNFLLWQGAYAEFVVMDELWPDFSGEDFDRALATFAQRERRFGGVPQT